MPLGQQEAGGSPWEEKEMAMSAKQKAFGAAAIPVSADIGAGAGEFTRQLSAVSGRVLMMDSYTPPALASNVEFVKVDLNERWPVDEASVDFACSLQVIEHVENPRHFMRELARMMRPGGFGYVSTPNNHSWASKLTFLLKGQHRYFQDASYPAHITSLLQCDLIRILGECQLQPVEWYFSNQDTIPGLHWRIRLRGKYFSNSLGILFQKV